MVVAIVTVMESTGRDARIQCCDWQHGPALQIMIRANSSSKKEGVYSFSTVVTRSKVLGSRQKASSGG